MALDLVARLDWLSALAAFAATTLALWLLTPLAPKLRLLDYPGGRKNHPMPTPVTGGVAMVAGVVAAAVGSPVVGDGFWGFVAAAAVLIGVGILDDVYDVRWYWRILSQVVAALIMIYASGVRVAQLGPAFGLDSMALGMLSVPFTVFATVGLINAINMMDGVDGLAGALVWCALLMLGAAALYAGNGLIAGRMMILVGAVAAFLMFNLPSPWRPRARLFMGNSGSAFLGLVVAWFSFRLTQNSGHPVNPVLALWLLPIPVMDTLVVMARRIRMRRSPFHPDRNHIHHLMLDAGVSVGRTVMLLSVFTLACGFLCGQAMRADVPNPVLLSMFGAMALAWYGFSEQRERALTLFSRLSGETALQRAERARAWAAAGD